MRLVLDTNTALSGLLWGGTPGSLIDMAIAGRVELASSTALLAELQGVLTRAKFAGQLAKRTLIPSDLFDGYAGLTVIIAPAIIEPTVLRDPPDDHVLACALAASADLVVSGDDDLLSLGSFKGIRIVTAAEAVKLIGG